jgi:hypothetical protein
MLGRSCFDDINKLRVERPEMPALVLSTHAEEQFGVRLLKAGVAARHKTGHRLSAWRSGQAGSWKRRRRHCGHRQRLTGFIAHR